MLERPKITPNQQPRSLGISPSDLASKSLGVKRESGQVTWGKISSDLGFKIGDRKRAQVLARFWHRMTGLHVELFAKITEIWNQH